MTVANEYMSYQIEKINNDIEDALEKAKRKKGDCKLVAVTKTVGFEKINEAIDLGIKIIGENKVQEFIEKEHKLHPVEKHFIGSLQRNKVKDIIDKVSLIHSVDRISLVKKISNECIKKEIEKINVLIQVNVGKEPNKSGIEIENLKYLLEEILKIKEINPIGLMSIQPVGTIDETRKYFTLLRNLRDDVKENYKKELPDFNELSMGMSADYIEAILEGATFVRVGSKLFGERKYK